RRKTGQICFEITLKSRRLIQQVQILLLNLGIVSRCVQRRTTYRYRDKVEERTYWRLNVSGQDVDLLMQIIPTCKAVPAQIRTLNTNRDTVPLPGSMLRALFTVNGRHSRREWWKWKREIKGDRRPTR